MQPQRYCPYTLLRASALLHTPTLLRTAAVLGLSVLAACASFPPAQFPQAPRSGAAPPGAERSAASASALEERARNSTGGEQAGLQLQAARAWLQSGRMGDVARVMAGLGAALTPVQVIERRVLEADIELANGQSQQAWQKMSAIPEPVGTPAAAQYYSSRTRIALAAARPVEGVRAEMAAEHLAVTPADHTRLRGELLQLLRQARERGVKLEPEASQDPTVRGWLELGAIASDGLGASISALTAAGQWRTRYPDHPATELLAAALPAPLPLSGKVHKLALLLPQSGPAAGYAAIIRSGFDYAYHQLPEAGRPELRVYDTGVLPVNDALAQARADGSDFVIGPLTRQEVDVAASADIRVPTLALNYLSVGRSAPSGLYQFALSPEEEARQLARRLLASGQKRGATLAPTGDWGTRVMAAFTQELLAGGGTLLAQAVYDAGGHDFGAPIRQVLATDQSIARRTRLESILGARLEFEPRSRADLDFIFAPGQAASLRLLRPQLRFQYAGNVSVYATSDAYAPDGGVANQDLDGLMIPAMPWLVPNSGTAQAVRQAVQADSGDSTAWQSGLFAFGYDACQLSLAIAASGRSLAQIQVAGLSGQLSVDDSGRVHREPLWARVTRSGTLQLIGGGPGPGAGNDAGATGE